jgi:hypothetical protein
MKSSSRNLTNNKKNKINISISHGIVIKKNTPSLLDADCFSEDEEFSQADHKLCSLEAEFRIHPNKKKINK